MLEKLRSSGVNTGRIKVDENIETNRVFLKKKDQAKKKLTLNRFWMGFDTFFNLPKLPCKFSDEEFQDEALKRIFDRILYVMIGLFFVSSVPATKRKKK